MNIRPDLFKVTVLHFPFLTVLTSLLDDSLPLTKSDYDEFGNPVESEEIFERIQSYCPYENILTCEYPSVMVICGSQVKQNFLVILLI